MGGGPFGYEGLWGKVGLSLSELTITHVCSKKLFVLCCRSFYGWHYVLGGTYLCKYTVKVSDDNQLEWYIQKHEYIYVFRVPSNILMK